MSSNDFAIRVQSLSKCFHIYDAPSDRLKQMLAPRLQRIARQQPKQYFQEFWALKDINFEIKKGETVGIIGRNGSGKSTLLQIICGTLTPSNGSVQTNGRIAALLELGSGFNPEFSGRENVYMNAAVLGLSTCEIDARFNDIVAFADIGDFIGQPVKTYSSGMMVRLAFAVAINVDPDILIIDEALSVGDELFQRKCFSRIETIKNNGATILFVSHSGGIIVELCDRALLMDSGERLATGSPKEIISRYQKLLYAPSDKHKAIRDQISQADKQNFVSIESTLYKDHAPPEHIQELQELQELNKDKTKIPELKKELQKVQEFLASEKQIQKRLLAEKTNLEQELKKAQTNFKVSLEEKALKDSLEEKAGSNLIKESIEKIKDYRDKNSKLEKRLDELNPFNKPPINKHDKYAKAVITLIKMAQHDCGGSVACAQVLLGLYNSQYWHVDLVDIACRMDEKHTNAALTAIRYRGELMTEPHMVIENGDKIFLDLWNQWESLHVEKRYARYY